MVTSLLNQTAWAGQSAGVKWVVKQNTERKKERKKESTVQGTENDIVVWACRKNVRTLPELLMDWNELDVEDQKHGDYRKCIKQ
jgi:hypothetical protein